MGFSSGAQYHLVEDEYSMNLQQKRVMIWLVSQITP